MSKTLSHGLVLKREDWVEKGFGNGYFILSSTLCALIYLVSSTSEVEASRKKRKKRVKGQGRHEEGS